MTREFNKGQTVRDELTGEICTIISLKCHFGKFWYYKLDVKNLEHGAWRNGFELTAETRV